VPDRDRAPDALWREYKIDHIDMPATTERIWMAIRATETKLAGVG
jgi:carbon-monoxide dehydrogenase large subunit